MPRKKDGEESFEAGVEKINEPRQNAVKFGLPPISSLPELIPAVIAAAVTIIAYFDTGINDDNKLLFILSLLSIVFMTGTFFIRIKPHAVTGCFISAIAPAAAFLLLESFLHNPFEIKWKIILFNMLFYYIVALLMIFLTRRTCVSVITVSAIALICGLTEHYVYEFRTAPIFPWDLASIGIMTTVVGNYKFTVTFAVSLSVCALMLLIYLGIRTGIVIRIPRGKIVRPIACLLIMASLGGYMYYLNLDRSFTDLGMYPYLFTPGVMYDRNGFTAAFISNLRYLSVAKPEGYSDEALSEIADEYIDKYNKQVAENPGIEDPDNITDKPNIIVIMNEAFSDLSILTDFETNSDYMPFLHSLTENTVKGNLHVSVLGGNTANTEFEFLTGCSMAYLPSGSVPYQQYIKGSMPNLVSQLFYCGYDTMAIHPYYASGWDRDDVYKWFGFNDILFKSDLPNLTILRKYVTDISVYRYIMNQLSDKDEDSRLFVFNVTMQNHGSYTTKYNNFIPSVHAVGLENETKLSQYLSLIKRSDSALKSFINFLSDYDENTIVLFFGDHQPAATVSNKLLKLHGVTLDDSDINDREQRYIVPFYLWANYDIEEKDYDAISVNYLSTLLCNTAGIGLTPYQLFLQDLYEEYPTVTANCFTDKDGTLHPVDFIDDEAPLNRYAMLQYNYLFGDGGDDIYGITPMY